MTKNIILHALVEIVNDFLQKNGFDKNNYNIEILDCFAVKITNLCNNNKIVIDFELLLNDYEEKWVYKIIEILNDFVYNKNNCNYCKYSSKKRKNKKNKNGKNRENNGENNGPGPQPPRPGPRNQKITNSENINVEQKNPEIIEFKDLEPAVFPIAEVIPNKWICKFKSDFQSKNYDWPKCFTELTNLDGVFTGISCCLTKEELDDFIQNNSDVIEEYYPDMYVNTQVIGEAEIYDFLPLSQSVPPFINRVGANGSSQRSGDGQNPNGNHLASKADINVFVLDTGISVHSDLNVVGGRNFTNTNVNDWTDRNGHGTHVAGIIGARDNNIGIVGIAPGVRLWAIKVLSDNGGGSISGIINALNWIVQNKGTIWIGNGIINMSLGGGISTALDSAVNNIINLGLPVVVAAGNSSIDANLSSPARVPNAITVGATSPSPSYNQLANYSNYGSVVDILAPGTNILSTYPGNRYATLSGTSMACPVVAGTLALLFSTNNISGSGLQYVNNIRNKIVSDSSLTNPLFYNGTRGSNPRVAIPFGKPTTNVSVWTGSY